jgi:hypothetical protein
MRVLLLFVLAYCCRSDAQDSIIVIRAGTSVKESVSINGLISVSHNLSVAKYFLNPEIVQ